MAGLSVRKVKSTKGIGNGKPFIAESLSFLAKSVRVDNYSGRWCRVDPDGRYIPPFTVGVVVNLYVETQTVAVILGEPTAVVQPFQVIDGEIVAEIYDDEQAPSAGMMINPPWVQARNNTSNARSNFDDDLPEPYQQYEIGAFGPLNFADWENNESFQQIQQRQLTTLLCFYTDIAVAGVYTPFWTNLGDQQRIMYLQAGVDRTCELQIEYSVWGNLFNGICMPGQNAVVPLPNNGFNLNGGALAALRAKVDVVPTRVYWAAGVGPE